MYNSQVTARGQPLVTVRQQPAYYRGRRCAGSQLHCPYPAASARFSPRCFLSRCRAPLPAPTRPPPQRHGTRSRMPSWPRCSARSRRRTVVFLVALIVTVTGSVRQQQTVSGSGGACDRSFQVFVRSVIVGCKYNCMYNHLRRSGSQRRG